MRQSAFLNHHLGNFLCHFAAFMQSCSQVCKQAHIKFWIAENVKFFEIWLGAEVTSNTTYKSIQELCIGKGVEIDGRARENDIKIIGKG